MRFSLFVALSAFASDVLAACPESKLRYCGSARYCPGEYTCYNKNQLCPIMDGLATKACGSNPYACYDPYKYDCIKGKLQEKPKVNYPYTLKAIGGPNVNNRLVNACGQAFYVTDLKACSYCPSQVPQQGGTCPKGDQTVFIGESSLYVEVPGGQQFYVTPKGLLGYTQAHSGSFPAGSMFGVTAYANGEFTLPGSSGWVACACTSAFSCPGIGLEIFAKLPNNSFSGQVCYDVTLLTILYKSGQLGYGAWQYT